MPFGRESIRQDQDVLHFVSDQGRLGVPIPTKTGTKIFCQQLRIMEHVLNTEKKRPFKTLSCIAILRAGDQC
jgi:hypothetical protein